MGVTLNDAEYFADTISKRVDMLLAENDNLKHEILRRSDRFLENNNAFVRSFQENIISSAIFSDRIEKLERILLQ